MIEDELNRLTESHDCSTCSPELKDKCTLKQIMPVIDFTLEWKRELHDGRKGEVDELMHKADDVVCGAFELVTHEGSCDGGTLMAMFRLLVAYGYIIGRKYVEVPKPYLEA